MSTLLHLPHEILAAICLHLGPRLLHRLRRLLNRDAVATLSFIEDVSFATRHLQLVASADENRWVKSCWVNLPWPHMDRSYWAALILLRGLTLETLNLLNTGWSRRFEEDSVLFHLAFPDDSQVKSLLDAFQAALDLRPDLPIHPDDHFALSFISAVGGSQLLSLLTSRHHVPPPTAHQCLLLAASAGHLDNVRILVPLLPPATSDPSTSFPTQLALQIASHAGHGQIVAALLDLIPSLDPTHDDDRCLRVAASHGRTPVVRLLLSRHPCSDSAYSGPDPWTWQDALRRACQHGHVEAASALLDTGRVDPTGSFDAALRSAVKYGHSDCVALLLGWVGRDGRRCNAAARDDASVKDAARHGHVGCFRMLIEWVPPPGRAAVDPASEDNLPLREAARFGHTEIVRMLLELPAERGVNAGAMKDSAIREAAKYNHVAVVEMLLKRADVNPGAEGGYALKYAARFGHKRVVETLLASGRVDPVTRNGMAMAWASQYGHHEVVTVLRNAIGTKKIQRSIKEMILN
ncbi:hypothetical protein HK101_009302 [Irineochytrium annulatum]|nr:hypothetical protein HK101_009302 [Irineochytrium annulatum]